MNFRIRYVRSALMFIAALSLVSCVGSPSVPIVSSGATSTYARLQPLIRTGNRSDLNFVDPKAISAQIYVSEYGTNGLKSYLDDYHAPNKNDKRWFCRIRSIRHSQNTAIEVDASGELWVPQGPEITSYAPNCGQHGTTLSEPGGNANDIAFGAKGIRYVSNAPDTGGGNIAVYPAGATEPTRTLRNAAVSFSVGVGVDSHENVYESFVNSSSNGGGVVEYRRGRMPGKLLENVTVTLPGPPLFDRSDNLIVTDSVSTTATVDIYAPPYNKPPVSFAARSLSYQCSLNYDEANLACADYGYGSVDIYKYPSGTYLYSINRGLRGVPWFTLGVAQYPRG